MSTDEGALDMMESRGQQRIPPYEIGSGSVRADRALEGIGRMFGGYIPILHRVMANSPATIEAFEAMRRLLQGTRLRAAEREIVAIEVARRNRCDYCMTAHRHLAGRLRVSAEDIDAAEAGTPLANERLALVQSATQRLIDRHGRLSDKELEGFRKAGLSDAELIEIVAVIGWYVMSTFTNNLAHSG
jgi:AhpD family alkylhydroperoxidase